VRFYFTSNGFLYDYNANLSKAVAAKRLPLTILCNTCWLICEKINTGSLQYS